MEAKDAACTACELYKGAHKQLLNGVGPKDAKVMLIGEAPGHDEDTSGIPFVGKSGKLLDSVLLLAGTKREDVFITNAVRCRPPAINGKQTKPSTKQLAACKFHLLREMAEVKPDLIITLGNESLKTLTGKSGVKAFRGQAQDLHKSALIPDVATQPVLIPTLHPAYALRYPEAEPQIIQDITTAIRSLQGGFREIDCSWVLAAETNVFADSSSKVWAYDIETNAKEYHDPELRIRCMAVDDGKNIVMYIGEDQCRVAAQVLEWCVNRGCVIVGHNASAFDRQVIWERFGINLKTDDTMHLAHLVDETQPLNLQDLAVRHLGVRPWKDKHDVHFWARGPQSEQEWKDALDYNARDTRYDRLLFQLLWDQADERERNLYRSHQLPVSRAVARMQRHGVYVSIPNAEAALAELEVDMRAELLILKHLTQVEFNPASHQQVRELLFSDMMLPPQGLTDGGEHSTDVTALKKLRAFCRDNERGYESQVIRALLKFREYGALIGFPKAFIEHARHGWTDKKGHMHPSLNPPWIYPSYSMTRTDTGRTSSFNPNLQQTPRNSKVRSAIAAPPGYVFMEVDGSQMEMRFAAELAGPQSALFQEFLKPKPDTHMQMAMRLTHKTHPEQVTKKERDDAKPVNFSLLYNPDPQAWRTLQRLLLDDYDMEWGEKECRLAQDAFREWGIRPWWRSIREELVANGHVTSIFGRKRRLPNIYHQGNSFNDEYIRMEAWRQACNAVVQSAASDYFLMFLTIAINMGFQVCGAIHDATLIILPADQAKIDEATVNLKWAFETETPRLVKEIFGYEIRLPMQADVKVGRWWADHEKLQLAPPPTTLLGKPLDIALA